MNDPVVPFDLTRMFFGTDPTLFYLEIVFRICAVYAYALLLIRWIGGRSIAQMSTVEFLLVIALGSAVGDAMFYPEVPLLHAFLVITGVVGINKILDLLIFRYRSVEKLIDGVTTEVIRDGVINLQTLRDNKIGKSELFENLREHGYVNLGQVRKAYLESSGRFSFFRARPSRPGLPIEPAWDVFTPEICDRTSEAGKNTLLACRNCGTLVEAAANTPDVCPHCSATVWTAGRLPERDVQ
ncbi:MAG: DUF421 domain-containing protein [Sulfitobacter sp. SK025]|nr:MAG: DUF421 domain-containing protein [Sulfitobacter sp. SK025]